MRALAYSFLVLSTAAGVTACSSDTTGPGPLAKVEISPDVSTIVVGDSIPVRAFGVDANEKPIDGLTITWSSSNEAVVTITPAGEAHAVSPGTAEIAASTGGVSASMEVTVTDTASPVGQ